MTNNTQSAEDILSPAAARALNNEAGLFSQNFRLTPRESEIVSVLSEGITRIKDIASRLRLSPNTVNNHVNSIFMKTKARSKSQLLAMLLGRLAEELQASRYFRQSPRVAFLTRDLELSSTLSAFLRRSGFSLQLISSMEAFEGTASAFSPHFAIVDLTMPLLEPRKFCAQTGMKVLYIGSNSLVPSRCEAMNLGAIDLFELKCEPGRVAQILLTHYIERESDRARFFVVPTSPKVARKPLEISARTLGKGGVFLSSLEVVKAFGEALLVGDRVEMKLLVEGLGKPLNAQGEVVWVRGETSTTPGAGVRLLHFNGINGEIDQDRSSWSDLIRRNSIQSYIPTGDVVSV